MFAWLNQGLLWRTVTGEAPLDVPLFLPLCRALLVNDWVFSERVVSEYFMMDKTTELIPLPCALCGQGSVLWKL